MRSTNPKFGVGVAIYSEAHVARLKLIAKLQDQGLQIKAIRELYNGVWTDELDLGDWLGLKAQLQTPWADDSPMMVTKDALFEFIGQEREKGF